MGALIKKDCYLMKKQLMSMPVMAVGFCVVFQLFGMAHMVPLYMGSVALSVCLSTFSYDELAKCQTYLRSLPLGVKKQVCAKYIFTAVAILLGVLLGALATLLFSGFQNTGAQVELAETLGHVFYFLMTWFLCLPFVYRFGIHKVIWAFTVVLGFGLAGGYVAVSSNVGSVFSGLFHGQVPPFATPLALGFLILLTGYISFQFSVKIASHK